MPAAGGIPAALTTLHANRGAIVNLQPFFLPGGRTFAYVSLSMGSVRAETYLASLDANVSPQRLPIEATVVQYASGHLWFLRGSTLMAQPLDPYKRAISGKAVPIAEQVRIDNRTVPRRRLQRFACRRAGVSAGPHARLRSHLVRPRRQGVGHARHTRRLR
ncbi:MAG: hypothetical protein ACREXP_01035 [Steroidobacteraceae bacterium]